MKIDQLRTLLEISRSAEIMRRYFVVNGFDGALAMLGLLAAFAASEPVELSVIITSALATGFALGMSGVSSAYISEAAERRRELAELEAAMISPLDKSQYARAAAWIPWLVAQVNGAAPFLVTLLIVAPLWIAHCGVTLPVAPLTAAIAVALTIVFLLGVFLGRVGGTFWLWSGLQSLTVALVTVGLILLMTA